MKLILAGMLIISTAVPADCVLPKPRYEGEVHVLPNQPLIVPENEAIGLPTDARWTAWDETEAKERVPTMRTVTTPRFRLFDLSRLKVGRRYELRTDQHSYCYFHGCAARDLSIVVDPRTPDAKPADWRISLLALNPMWGSHQPGLPFITTDLSFFSVLKVEGRNRLASDRVLARLVELRDDGTRIEMTALLRATPVGTGTVIYASHSGCGTDWPIDYGKRYELFLYSVTDPSLPPLAGWRFTTPRRVPFDERDARVFAEVFRLERSQLNAEQAQAKLMRSSDAYRDAARHFREWETTQSEFTPEQLKATPIPTAEIQSIALTNK